MTDMDKDTATDAQLDGIRRRIDAIDKQLHRLLIDRSAVIDELIRVKHTERRGAAFRPGREATMMRRLAVEHSGSLPLAAVEHIWREIITTFTAIQAPFGVVAPAHADADALRDLVRFYFGFSVPVTILADAAAAIAHVRETETDLAVVPLSADGAWWRELGEDPQPQVIARLPFVEVPGRPADLAAYVIAPPLADAGAPDTSVVAVSMDGDPAAYVQALQGAVVANAGDEWLIEVPASNGFFEFALAAENVGMPSAETRIVGGFHSPVKFVSDTRAGQAGGAPDAARHQAGAEA